MTHNEPAVSSAPKALWGAVLALILLPLALTPVVPTIDFYAHVARFYILGAPDASAEFALNYAPAWRLLPNLGLDVLGTAIMGAVPPLLGAKFLAGLIILAPILGSLSLARAIHGRVGVVNLALAGLTGYSLILGWGFANFLLGLGLALWALGLWIGQDGRPARQLLLAMVLGVVIFFVHGLVFALWGLLLAAVEVMLACRAGWPGLGVVVVRLSRLVLVAIVPAVLFALSRTSGAEGGVTVAFANLAAHAEQGNLMTRVLEEITKRIDSLLRVSESTRPWVDRGFGLVLWVVLAGAMAIGALRLDRRLWLAVALAVVLVGLTPPNLFGVGHLDERIPLVLLALLAAGLAPGPRQGVVPGLLVAGLVLHQGLVAQGWWDQGQSYRRFLTAAQALPQGGLATATFFGSTDDRDPGRPCKPLLYLLLLERGMAVPTFANPTQQPLTITGPLQAAIAAEASQPPDLGRADRLHAAAAAGFGTIVACDSAPEEGEPVPGLTLAAQDRDWRLYRAE